jgi:hypothetical protein
MKIGILALVLSCACASFLAGCESVPDRGAKPVRVGTYHAPSLVVAWVRSAEHARELEGLVAARDAALKAGDTAKVAECERKGAESQDLAHRQLAGEAGIEDILAKLEGDFPEVMKEARVERIAAEGEVQGEKVEVVDVTDLLVARFHPDEATRKLLAEVRKYPQGVRVH